MIKLDRAKFFAEMRNMFHDINQSQVDGLNQLLDFMAADAELTDHRFAAYMLATARHETYNPKTQSAFHPIAELGSKAYFKKYDGRVDLGNKQVGDGYRFRGRGYPQTTGRRNYLKLTEAWLKTHPNEVVDFIFHPDLLLEPKYAYFSMSYCMRVGMYTGKKLSDYIKTHEVDYKNARRVINRLDQADKIAEYAKKFEIALTTSLIVSQSPTPNTITPPPPPPPPVDQESGDQVSMNTPLGYATDSTPIPVVQSGVIQASMNTGKRLMTWLTSVGVSIGTVITGIVTFAKENPVLAVVIILAALVLVGGGTFYYQHLMSRADEQRRRIAADPTLNNVR